MHLQLTKSYFYLFNWNCSAKHRFAQLDLSKIRIIIIINLKLFVKDNDINKNIHLSSVTFKYELFFNNHA